MSEPLVSIITPAYNEERFIDQTLESVQGQTYQHVEHIVMDGQSDDATLDILSDYEGTYNLSVHSQPDDGMYDAIEKGFDLANGDIFAWLNANDVYFPWTTEVVAEELGNNDMAWLTGRRAHVDELGRVSWVDQIRPYYKQSWIRRGWYNGQGLGWFCQPSVFWTRDLWEAVGGFPVDADLAADHYLFKAFGALQPIESVNTLLGAHRFHDGQLSGDISVYYDEIDTGFLPRLLGKLYVNRLYCLYRMLRE